MLSINTTHNNRSTGDDLLRSPVNMYTACTAASMAYTMSVTRCTRCRPLDRSRSSTAKQRSIQNHHMPLLIYYLYQVQCHQRPPPTGINRPDRLRQGPTENIYKNKNRPAQNQQARCDHRSTGLADSYNIQQQHPTTTTTTYQHQHQLPTYTIINNITTARSYHAITSTSITYSKDSRCNDERASNTMPTAAKKREKDATYIKSIIELYKGCCYHSIYWINRNTEQRSRKKVQAEKVQARSHARPAVHVRPSRSLSFCHLPCYFPMIDTYIDQPTIPPLQDPVNHAYANIISTIDNRMKIQISFITNTSHSCHRLSLQKMFSIVQRLIRWIEDVHSVRKENATVQHHAYGMRRWRARGRDQAWHGMENADDIARASDQSTARPEDHPIQIYNRTIDDVIIVIIAGGATVYVVEDHP